jgi:hypothetical protein
MFKHKFGVEKSRDEVWVGVQPRMSFDLNNLKIFLNFSNKMNYKTLVGFKVGPNSFYF